MPQHGVELGEAAALCKWYFRMDIRSDTDMCSMAPTTTMPYAVNGHHVENSAHITSGQRWYTHDLRSGDTVDGISSGNLLLFPADGLPTLSQGTNSPALIPLPETLTIPNLPLNLGVLACLSYCGLYILLEPVAGTVLATFLLAGTAYANHLTSEYGMTANFWAAGAHVVCWIAQFIGHGVFEGRAPALLDNLFQAIFLAPLFVWLELLFSLGYRPELKRRLDKMIEQDIAKFRESKKQKLNGAAKSTENGHAKAT